MKVLKFFVVGAAAFCSAIYAEVSVSSIAAVEFTKKCSDASSGNFDGSWVRAELMVKGTLPNSRLSGLTHLRLQPDMASKANDNKYNLQARQIYFRLPVSIVNIIAGRWYEIYGPGYNYFGRYLVECKPVGNGSMNTDYTILDGLKLQFNIDRIRSALQISLLPQNLNFEDAYVLAMFGGNPFDGFKFNIGGNFEAICPEGKDPVNRFMVNAGYTVLKRWATGIFGEMTITDFNNASDNMWFLAGFTTKAGPVLDRVQLELEIKNHRPADSGIDDNVAWMLLLKKNVFGLILDLNIGADPAQLGSKEIGDVGAIFRATAMF